MDTYYDLLGVSPASDLKTIKRAYHQQLKQIHPDVSRHPANNHGTVLLNEAFATLSKSQSRRAYDAHLALEASQATAVATQGISRQSWLAVVSMIFLWSLAFLLIYLFQSSTISNQLPMQLPSQIPFLTN